MKVRAIYVFPGDTVFCYGRKCVVAHRTIDRAPVLSCDTWIGFVFSHASPVVWYRFHEWVEVVESKKYLKSC